ncbi:hypothetical protein BLOT_008545 [Blomia tropicalis]|nr:hypothetical protein BLOT_008545 [Blomia tropicalis]
MDLTMIKWITVMLIIIMIIIGESFQFHRTKRDSITNDLCHNMDNGNFTTNIRGSFIFSDRLIFISNNWLVYELPTTNLDKAFGQLLMNVTSLPIEKHWKAFNKNKRFKKIKDEIIAIYSLQHESSQYLYFDVYNKQGIVFDLRKKVLHNSGVDYKNQNYGIRDQTITSINSMYTLSTKYNGSSSTIGGIFDWEIKWGFKKDWLYEGNAKTFYFLFYGKRKSDGVRDRIALVESKNVKHVKSPDPDYDLIKMDDLGYPPPCGYLYRTYFYLFVKSKVYVFVGNRWNRRNLVALWEKLTIFDTKSFFVCKESELQKVTNPPLVTQDGLQLQSLSNTPEDMGIHIHLYVPTEDPKLTIYIFQNGATKTNVNELIITISKEYIFDIWRRHQVFKAGILFVDNGFEKTFKNQNISHYIQNLFIYEMIAYGRLQSYTFKTFYNYLKNIKFDTKRLTNEKIRNTYYWSVNQVFDANPEPQMYPLTIEAENYHNFIMNIFPNIYKRNLSNSWSINRIEVFRKLGNDFRLFQNDSYKDLSSLCQYKIQLERNLIFLSLYYNEIDPNHINQSLSLNTYDYNMKKNSQTKIVVGLFGIVIISLLSYYLKPNSTKTTKDSVKASLSTPNTRKNIILI